MKESAFCQEMAELLTVEVSELSDEYRLDSSGRWDSFTIVSLMGAINQYYDIILSADKLMQCQTIKEVFQLIEINKRDAHAGSH